MPRGDANAPAARPPSSLPGPRRPQAAQLHGLLPGLLVTDYRGALEACGRELEAALELLKAQMRELDGSARARAPTRRRRTLSLSPCGAVRWAGGEAPAAR